MRRNIALSRFKVPEVVRFQQIHTCACDPRAQPDLKTLAFQKQQQDVTYKAGLVGPRRL